MRERELYRDLQQPNGCSGLFYPHLGDTTSCSNVSKPSKVYREGSRIEDQNNRSSRPSSPVNHWQCKIHPFPVTAQGHTQYSADWFYNGCDGLGVPANLPGTYPAPDWDPIKREARQNLVQEYGTLVEEFSLLNNIFELGEIPELITNVLKSADRAIKNGELNNKSFSLKPKRKSDLRKFGESLREVELGKGYLSYEFGVAPLARDIASLFTNLESALGKLQGLAKGSKSTPQRFNRLLSPQIKHVNTEYFNHSVEALNPVIQYKVRMTGTLSVRIPPLDDLYNGLKFALDNIGFHADPRVIYDAIPFTWFIDWFYPIGDWLKQMEDRRWVKPQIILSNSSVSASCDHTTLIRLYRPFGYPAYTQDSLDMGIARAKLYFRTPMDGVFQEDLGIPDAPDFRLPELDVKKLAILAGLLDGPI